jgi:hypothetical protein
LLLQNAKTADGGGDRGRSRGQAACLDEADALRRDDLQRGGNADDVEAGEERLELSVPPKREGLVALHPQRDRIYVEMVLGRAEADRALAQNLTDAATKAFHAAPQGRDGRWIHLSVASAADTEDVEKLLVAKVRPPRAKERG